jgi:hypothetical protein
LSTLLVALSLASLVSISPGIFHSVHAAGIVYVNHPTVTDPTSTAITVQVQVDGVDPFDGWNIQVKSNQSVISPTSLSVRGNALEANYSESVFEMVNCVNGVNYTSSHCDPSDRPGIVHSAAVTHHANPPTIGSVYGLLFTINYTVIRIGLYSPLQILRAIILNGQDLVSVTTRDGSYGIPFGQGFSLTASPDSPRIVIGSKANVTLTISSYGGYAGIAELVLEGPPSGLRLSLNATSITLSPSRPSNVTLTIATDPGFQPSQYVITVRATSNGLSHTAIVSILTTAKPDFVIDVSPSVLEIHATSSGSSIINVSTQSDFSSPIRLSVTVPLVPGLNVDLGAKDLMISPSSPATTHLDFQTPDSPIPFVYRVNITATSQFSSHTVTVLVIPPQPDFSFLLGGTSHMVQAGESRTLILAVTSVDYFKGQLFLFASSRFGFEEVFSPPTIALDFGNSSISTMTLTTDANSEPGNRNVTLTAIGTTSTGASVTHIIVLTLTVTQGRSSNTILGLMSLPYLGAGVVGALSLATILFVVRNVRRLKQA